GDTIYTCNSHNEVFALDAATGRQRWSFDASMGSGDRCRGVSFYAVPNGGGGVCSTRILTGSNAAKLIALDAQTGQPCSDFGEAGVVDLLVGMGDANGKIVKGYYRPTSAPAIVRGKVVVGGYVSDNQYW